MQVRVLATRAAALGLEPELPEWAPGRPAPERGAVLWHCPAGATVTAGQPDPDVAEGEDVITEMDLTNELLRHIGGADIGAASGVVCQA